MYKTINFKSINEYKSILLCLVMSCTYVFSLYLWNNKYRYNRNEKSVILRRFLSVTLACLLSVALLYYVSTTATTTDDNDGSIGHKLHVWIGFRFDLTLLLSTINCLILTISLFIGPILQWYLLKDNYYQRPFTFDIIFLRNYIVGPFSEEFVFRSCMIPIFINNFSFSQTCYLTPLYFGIAHLHHIIEGIAVNDGKRTLLSIIFEHLFQFFYTYLFGLYSSFLFLRTANFFPCFISHSFCNLMGFPNLNELKYSLFGYKRWLVVSLYVIGLILFLYLLKPLTKPTLYDNTLYHS